ncbi:MAG: hypothetical protein LBG50_04010 [Clostridiales Family XIII bacterium]|jgi:hypothetical protein|nr:hypothetical protein [Clostridiales Family XIII bacterium]
MRENIFKKMFIPRAPVGAEVASNIITRKAEAKLDYVADTFKAALGPHCTGVERSFLDKTLLFKGLSFIDHLRLRYRVENRFFAVMYDLVANVTIPVRGASAPSGDVRIAAELKGKMFVKDAAFALVSCGEGDAAQADKIMELLGTELIRERILSLDLADIQISYSAGAGEWDIKCRSIIGSTTWNLIPPITQLIKPKQEECVRLVEFYELIASCLA